MLTLRDLAWTIVIVGAALLTAWLFPPRHAEDHSLQLQEDTMTPLTEVKSSAVKAFGYDAGARVLVIQTPGGKSYSYADVPADVAQQFAKAESFGKAWGSLIRGKFDLVSEEGAMS